MRLSIITICRNDAEGLRRTMSSVLSQTFKSFEYIVIDGGSDDGSADVIKEQAGRLAYWVSEKDRGIYHAMNKGIEKAKGEYCLFLNSGDFLAEDTVLEKVFGKVKDESIVYGDMIIDYDGDILEAFQPSEITFEFLVLTTIWHPVTFIKTKLFETIGKFNEELKIVSDWEFILKAAIIHNVSTLHVDILITVFNTKGIGSDPKYKSLQDAERMQVLKKHFPERIIKSAQQFNDLKRSRAVVLADWLKIHPFFNGIAKGVYGLLNLFRKLFRL